MKGARSLRVICWQPVLTDHQAATFTALAAIPGVQLSVVTSRADNHNRPGWQAQGGVLMTERLPSRGWFARIRAILAERDAVHIFGTPFDMARQSLALGLALARHRSVFLLSEPYASVAVGYFNDRRPWLARLKHRVRPWLYRMYGMILAGRVSGVFAISPRAVRQFRGMGIPAARVVPFGYFVPAQAGGDAATKRTPDEGRLRCVYVGSLIRRKGVETMLAAFARSLLLQERATLDVYGPGEITAQIPAGVMLRGALAYGAAGAVMAAADVVIVPSLSDGWAAVVNEAVLAGTPVVVGDAAGAAAMVAAWGCGEVFPSGDAAALAASLERLVTDPDMLHGWRAATAGLAAALDPDVAGGYMHTAILAVLRGDPAPPAPWYPDPG